MEVLRAIHDFKASGLEMNGVSMHSNEARRTQDPLMDRRTMQRLPDQLVDAHRSEQHRYAKTFPLLTIERNSSEVQASGRGLG